MTVLQVIALVLVAVSGTVVVAVRDVRRLAVVSGVFGLALAILFMLFQAPDVALSQIVVAGVGLPVMLLLTIARIERGGDE